MAYCTVDQVQAIVNTDIPDADILELIEETDTFIDLKIPGASATVKRAVSRTWTAYRCMLKDPNSRSIGEYSENRSEALRQLWAQVDMYIGMGVGGISVTVGRGFP